MVRGRLVNSGIGGFSARDFFQRQHQINIEGGAQKTVQLHRQSTDQPLLDVFIR